MGNIIIAKDENEKVILLRHVEREQRLAFRFALSGLTVAIIIAALAVYLH